MVAVHLPNPVRRVEDAGDIDVERLREAMRRRVDGEVRFDAGSRSAYSTDASNFRQVPIGVVVPRTVEAGADAVAVCREFGAPVLSRGGGTSLAGECTNVAVVIDWSKYCNRLLSVDAERRTCVVEPGIVLDHLNDLLREHGLEYGPEPATHNHCTLGGMIGNNSCGATAQRTGKVVDNIERLEVLLYDGTRMWVGATSDEEYERVVAQGGRPAEVYRQLRQLRDAYLEQLRTGYPAIPRRVSGYNLDSLLPEQNFHLAKTLIGSEGTLVTVLRAELKLVPRVPARSLVVLGFPDIAAAADAVPQVLTHDPIALEGIDHLLVEFQRRKHLNPQALRLFPDGTGFLLVQFGGADREEARGKAEGMVRAIGRDPDGPDVTHFDTEEQERQVWLARESGLGATARVPGLPDTWPGWEDSAVAPDRLGDYLRDLKRLYDEFGYAQASLYGHFGQGCVHSRIPFDLVTADGVRAYRAFLERAADLVAGYGGSFSGEHGDGQQRGELLPKMFGPQLVRAFEACKAIFDPDNRMNPGKVVAPNRLDEDLRLGTDFRHPAPETHFAYPDDEGSFSRAVLRCVGVGKCRREGGGVMCPSYMATREEEHSTRGRSRLLFEMLDGTARGGAIDDGWRSEAVRDALDLCLACKGCKTDCPVNVDMAKYKAEFLAHHYEGRLRPRSHYAMGWLPLWAALASRAPRVVNALAHAGPLGTLAKHCAGVDVRRDLPVFARRPFQRWFRGRRPAGPGTRGDVVLWPDTFTNHFDPAIAEAAVTVLEDAGWRVVVPEQALCCGLTWISTGQLDTAKRVLLRTVAALRPHLRAGTPIVGLEPSCTAVFRSDAYELFPHDEDVQRLREQTFTLAELLHEHSPGWRAPQVPRKALIQTHCHQHAVLGFDADQALLHDTGVDAQVLDSGCCGLAGNFGFEEGHYDVSVACADRVLVPAVRDADPQDVVLADGFSCRTQIEQSATGGRRGMHLAELLRAGLDGDDGRAVPERSWAPRPAPPRPSVAGLVLAGTLAGAAAIAAVALRRRR
ncbi:FAD-binding and (Fe-S)-binding domain-containing protein [Dactylosporangium matsuzakiense]|nr:FAD-binding and (Fe-S)-binding domain-containing protein [Dactylosporangium matsuzakiense]UWZ49898.1 FAD-binding protein [Dactylosporangium matsuzakiense]